MEGSAEENDDDDDADDDVVVCVCVYGYLYIYIDMFIYLYDSEPPEQGTSLQTDGIMTMTHVAIHNSLINNVWWCIDITNLSILNQIYVLLRLNNYLKNNLKFLLKINEFWRIMLYYFAKIILRKADAK